MAKIKEVSREAILKELQKRAAQAEKPKFTFDTFCFDKQKEFLRGEGARFRAACTSRRCLHEDTLVLTETGSRPIKSLKVGDKVWGYNLDGSSSLSTIKEVYNQGVQEVVDLYSSRTNIVTCTEDHKFLSANLANNKESEKKLIDFNSNDRLKIITTDKTGGYKEIKSAYAIGALLGDGCSRNSGLTISSGDENVVRKVMECLEFKSYKKSHASNYTWIISNGTPGIRTYIPFYDEWCRGKYAHEKTVNLEEVRTWNRRSQIDFISGLLDTDGSVGVSKDGRLVIRISMQAKPIIYAVKMLLLDLFQSPSRIKVDNREKYKNGPVYEVCISNNKYSKRVLRELTTVVDRKSWKDEYELLNERNTNKNWTGFRKSKSYKAQCYDIHIDNNTNLFLLANGIISHNSGKSTGIAADIIDSLQTNKDITLLYITGTHKSVKDIIWNELSRIIEEYKIECKQDNVNLSLYFPNGSRLLTGGCKDKAEIEKFRGLKLYRVYIDECQSIRPHIKELIKDILIPALRDLRGSLILTGTPGPIKAGAFFEFSTSKNWHTAHWTAFDNPHMHNLEKGLDLHETLKEECILNGTTPDDASYKRENLGLWVEDLESLVFKYNESVNHYDFLPNSRFDFIIGIDIGFNDRDAIAVLGYSHATNEVYLVEEWEKNKQDITALAEQIDFFKHKYNPIKMVMDAGALGKKINEELRVRNYLNIEAADKARKLEHIEFLNADMRRGIFRAKKDSIFAQDSKLVSWEKTDKGLVISTTYHSDIADSVLYAYRECKHYIKIEPTKKSETVNEVMDAFWEQELRMISASQDEKDLYEYEKSLDLDSLW